MRARSTKPRALPGREPALERPRIVPAHGAGRRLARSASCRDARTLNTSPPAGRGISPIRPERSSRAMWIAEVCLHVVDSSRVDDRRRLGREQRGAPPRLSGSPYRHPPCAYLSVAVRPCRWMGRATFSTASRRSPRSRAAGAGADLDPLRLGLFGAGGRDAQHAVLGSWPRSCSCPRQGSITERLNIPNRRSR